MKKIAGILAIGIVFNIIAIAAEDQKRPAPPPQTLERLRPAASERQVPDAQRGPVVSPERMQNLRERNFQPELLGHQEIIRELEAIKKIAQEENAVKTAEAVQALIDRKTFEYQRQAAEQERIRRHMQKKLDERKQNQLNRQPVMSEETAGQSADSSSEEAVQAEKKERKPKDKVQ